MIASSSSSPPTRMDWETTIPPRLMTATSDVPPPMSTTLDPGGPAPGDAADHRSRRPPHRQPRPDGSGHRLLDQVGGARAGAEAGLLDRALLDARHARRHADHDARVRPPVLMHLLD